MPDLLLELRSEEIPARMQRKAAGDLKKLVADALVEAGLTYEGAREYWTPRRLTLDMRGVDARSKDVAEERKGPRADAPPKAIEGFLRGAGLTSIEEAEIRSDPKKGDFYVATIRKPGRPAEAIVAEVVPGIIKAFPWPKSMRWGPASAVPGSLRWVRPLQSILCTFGPETEEPAVVEFEVDGIRSGNVTVGHRFHAPRDITVRRFGDYAEKLEKAFVVLDAARRKEIIRHDAETLAFARGLEVVPDEALLEEVADLVEWPVALMGEFEPEFLQIPPEIIRSTIRANQKCFVTRQHGAREPGAGGAGQPSPGRGAEPSAQGAGVSDNTLSNRFVLVSNIEASDGGAAIAAGNGKVVRARLSDALYFWRTDQGDLPDLDGLKASADRLGLDLKKPLDQRMAKLDALGVTFHAKLGTQGERVARIAALAQEIARTVYPDGATLGSEAVSADDLAALAKRAAVLAKADLTTETVGEFPELQGLMGRYYAALQGEHPSVQAAIEEHYKPLGPTDSVPSDPLAVCVALADKLDTLIGFWAIDEKPTGSKDPYALRRAALGVIRIVVEKELRVGLYAPSETAYICLWNALSGNGLLYWRDEAGEEWGFDFDIERDRDGRIRAVLTDSPISSMSDWDTELRNDEPSNFSKLGLLRNNLLSFFHDRLKVQLRDSGARHDLVDAVLSGGEDALDDDLLDITRRVEALGHFLDTEDGKNLLTGTRRAANILAAEEKKGTRVADAVDLALLSELEERALAGAVDRAEIELQEALAVENYAHAMAALANLRIPVDAFFDKVLVNADDEAVRANRLALLARIRTATRRVADFSRIAG